MQWEQLQDRLQRLRSVGMLERAVSMVEEGVAVIIIRGAVQGCVENMSLLINAPSLTDSL